MAAILLSANQQNPLPRRICLNAFLRSADCSSFQMQCLGRWWATLPRDQWPEEAVDEVLPDFDDPSHDEISDGLSKSVGDRRQEVVLIGPGLGDTHMQNVVKETLDECLLTKDEFEAYKKISRDQDEDGLKSRFQSPIPVQMMTY